MLPSAPLKHKYKKVMKIFSTDRHPHLGTLISRRVIAVLRNGAGKVCTGT